MFIIYAFTNYKVRKVCPTCGKVCGIITGDQPEGMMDIIKRREHLEGYKRYKTIAITYSFASGKQGVCVYYLSFLLEFNTFIFCSFLTKHVLQIFFFKYKLKTFVLKNESTMYACIFLDVIPFDKSVKKLFVLEKGRRIKSPRLL
jgi:hypothetical protein